jgi:hypothetical protein
MKTAILALAGTAFLILLAVIVYRSPEHSQTTIDLLKVLSAWPPILLGLALYFMHRYHDEIRSFLNRATKVGPGGIEAEKQPPPPKAPEPELATAAAESVKVEQPSRSPSPAGGDSAKSAENISIPKGVLQYIVRDRESWKLQFLNQFLVHTTKSVLAWFFQRPSATLEEYDRTWRFSIPEPDQRARVIDALVQYELLSFTENGLQITDEGRRALEFFGKNSVLAFMQPLPMPLTGPVSNLGFGPASALESLRRLAVEHGKKPPEPGGFLEALLSRRAAKEELSADQKGLDKERQ